MQQDRPTRAIQDQHEIADVLMRWGHARDADDWDGLASCFHDDATIGISWIADTAHAFIAASRDMAARRPPGAHMKHVFSGPLILVDGDRAFSRCHAALYARAVLDGREVDLQSHFRFFDLFERRAGPWRILKRTAVYEKDRMDPVVPGAHNAPDLSTYQPEVRHLSYFLETIGYTPRRVPVVYSAEEKALRQEGLDWIAGKGMAASPRA